MKVVKAIIEVSEVLNPTTELVELALEELNEECAHVLHLVARLRRLPEGGERDTLEGDLYAALTHLQMEAAVALEEWNKLTLSLPED